MNLIQKISNWYFTKKALPYWCILTFDCVLVMFSGYVGYYLKLGGDGFAQYFWQMTRALLVGLLPFIVVFRLLHTYSGIIRYSSFVDIQRVALASLSGTVLFLLTGYAAGLIFPEQSAFLFPTPFTALCMFAFSTLLLGAERVVVRRLYDSFNTDGAFPAAVYGARDGGISIAKSILAVKEKQYVLYAFISDDPAMKDTYLMGQRVYVNAPGLARTLADKGVKVLLVPHSMAERFRADSRMIDEFIAAGIRIMMSGRPEIWNKREVEKQAEEVANGSLHEVEIEDLLPREKIEVDMEAVAGCLNGKAVLITGAAGSIGSEIVRQVALYRPSELILIDQAETPMHDIRLMMAREFADIPCSTIVADVTDSGHMERIFSSRRPQYVFHAAAYKHVPMMEDNPSVAVRNNVYGTRIVADLAVKYGAEKFVMISTDKAVNPTSVMGCSKRISEIYCQSLNGAILRGEVAGKTQFVTTRFGNVLGSNGSVIPIFREQIRRGGPVTVTHPEIIRYFMLIPEACRLVLEAAAIGKGGEIFVFDMGQPVKIVDLARRMIALSGAKNIEIEFTGLRDGEKLYEEVLAEQENILPTVNPKIMVAKVREYDYAIACLNENRLLEAALGGDGMEVVGIMKEIVPEYRSSGSRYAALDAVRDGGVKPSGQSGGVAKPETAPPARQ